MGEFENYYADILRKEMQDTFCPDYRNIPTKTNPIHLQSQDRGFPQDEEDCSCSQVDENAFRKGVLCFIPNSNTTGAITEV